VHSAQDEKTDRTHAQMLCIAENWPAVSDQIATLTLADDHLWIHDTQSRIAPVLAEVLSDFGNRSSSGWDLR
jgi:hypothetical protein